MRYHVLCCDYDGTLALNGRVDTGTLVALERVRASGRRLVLVTGRELDDLLRVFPRIDLFDRVIAENGALLYRPGAKEVRLLGEPPPNALVDALRARGVAPLSVGRSIVATWTPHETTVLEAIRDLGLEHQVIFNKGAVMVLPAGVNKATGLCEALDELALSAHNAVGVGDAENDHAFLSACECGVAVANALPMLKERADFVTAGDHGAGVAELAQMLMANDLMELEPRLTRHEIPLGVGPEDMEIRIKPYGESLLVGGPSASGKSTVVGGFLERLSDHCYQYCVLDPEGDYEAVEEAVVLGTPERAPSADEVLGLLHEPSQNAIVNLLGIKLEDRPAFFEGLLPRLQELRARTGRPHWIVVDEAHHLLPSAWGPAAVALPQGLAGLVLITVHPDHVSSAALAPVDTVVAVGMSPEQTMRAFFETLGWQTPELEALTLDSGEAYVWSEHSADRPVRCRIIPSQTQRRRHSRKYAEGDLGPHSFYFRGPNGALNLRAQNLALFNQIADGVDDATWIFHLRQGDYSRWFREKIKDPALADEAYQVELDVKLSAQQSRELIRHAIERRYTGAA
jgi:hydroxymethylpyrimidine pyrophosphatase-like HAD family hydrolase